MIKTIAVTAFAGALPLCAYAQSSVSLYGVVDTGLTFVSNEGGSRAYSAAGCVMSGCRFGLSGNEDLGGGLRAIFVLESGFNSMTGKTSAGGTFFGRKAYVGLSGSAGTVTLGRQYATMVDFVGPFESGSDWDGGGPGYGEHPDDVDNLNTSNKINNAIKYVSPVSHGFRVGGMYSVGGVAGHAGRDQIISVDMSYDSGPFKAAAGWQVADQPNFSFFGTNVNASATGNNMRSAPLLGYASAGSQQIIAAAASYTVGIVTFGAVYSNVVFRNLGGTQVVGLTPLEASYRGNVKFNTGEVNLKVMLTPALQAGLAYFITDGQGKAGQSNQLYRQVNSGLDYFLSKATDLYALLNYQRVNGASSTGTAAVAYMDGTAASSNRNQVLTSVGIRHRF